MNRRDFFNSALLGGLAVGSQGILASCSSVPKHYSDSLFHIKKSSFTIPKLKLSSDRIVKETVGLRPFRSKGPRVEKEVLGSKTLVHNYGHGGSGWSLSWGTGNQARNLVLGTGAKEVALIGCGTVGIATATLLQESGIDVTIYTKDVPPNVTSNLATGTWSPASRVCDKSAADPDFEERWADATNFSFRRLQMMLGVEDIVQWTDEYVVHNTIPKNTDGNGGHELYHVEGLVPEWKELHKSDHPFKKAELVRRRSNVVFNIPSYLNFHLNNFLLRGGKLKIQEMKSLEDLDALPQKVIVNCMGLGAKAIMNDEYMMPISGQLACLIPQGDVTYKLATQGAYFITRKDGIYLGGSGKENSWDTTPDRALTEKWVDVLSELMREMKG